MAAAVIDTIGRGPLRYYLLHGILGSGRNWRSFTRRLVSRRPDLTVHLVDQRAHGQAPPSDAPHTLGACAADLIQLESHYGAADGVIGHSFGGKVALAWAEAGGSGSIWVLDSPPGVPDGEPTDTTHGALAVLHALDTCPVPAPTRQAIREHLLRAGLSEAITMWLLTSTRRADDGWRWVYDLPAVHDLLDDYFRRDLWPTATGGLRAHLVMAERSDRWSPREIERAEAAGASGQIAWHVLADAGHWLHVDNPDGLLTLLEAHL